MDWCGERTKVAKVSEKNDGDQLVSLSHFVYLDIFIDKKKHFNLILTKRLQGVTARPRRRDGRW